MILLPRPLLKTIADAAEAAYPDECCGLLVGYPAPPDSIVVTRVEPSPNVAENGAATGDRFEVSPELRFRLMHALEGGPERIVGHYHSHPDHPAQPSERDLAQAYEPDLVWLIAAVLDGQAIHITAHALDAEARQFREIALRTTDWRPYPIRPEDDGADADALEETGR